MGMQNQEQGGQKSMNSFRSELQKATSQFSNPCSLFFLFFPLTRIVLIAESLLNGKTRDFQKFTFLT